MKFTLTLDTDNAAFEDDRGQEIARILKQTAQRMTRMAGATGFSFPIRDTNGNTVGRADLQASAPSPVVRKEGDTAMKQRRITERVRFTTPTEYNNDMLVCERCGHEFPLDAAASHRCK